VIALLCCLSCGPSHIFQTNANLCLCMPRCAGVLRHLIFFLARSVAGLLSSPCPCNGPHTHYQHLLSHARMFTGIGRNLEPRSLLVGLRRGCWVQRSAWCRAQAQPGLHTPPFLHVN
jgi:hypothetical protein